MQNKNALAISRITDNSRFEQLLRDAAQDSVWLAPDSVIFNGRFRIVRQLGHGGMGVVYEAMDLDYNTLIALKTLYDSDDFGMVRMKKEFRALTDVVHPNLVGLHDLFVKEKQCFFTMDIVPGDTLIKQLGDFPPPKRVRQTFLQLAQGIHAIHTKGKLHRDLKPNNVMLTPNDQVVILDFGLVRDEACDSTSFAEVSGGISGTPTYMAPEQAAGKPAVRGSDWYAFGVMLFEVLARKAPFDDRPSNELLYQKQHMQAPVISSVNSGISKDLEQLCQKLLSRNPTDRPEYEEIVTMLSGVNLPKAIDPFDNKIPFLGRTEELEILQNGFIRSQRNHPVVTFVHGISGIGKTTLIKQFLKESVQKENTLVLSGRCYERESIPYKACDSMLDQLFHYIGSLPFEEARELLPLHVAALVRIFPAMGCLRVVRKELAPLPQDLNEIRRMGFGAVKELLTNISVRKSLILFVDDLQWCDMDGVKLLGDLITPPSSSILFIGAYRSDEVKDNSALNFLLHRFSTIKSIAVDEIKLKGLSEKDANSMVCQLLPSGTKRYAGCIVKESGGSPFFIKTIVKFSMAAPFNSMYSPNIENTIAEQIKALSSSERDLLRMICLVGKPVEKRLLVAAIENNHFASGLRTLCCGHLIRHTCGRDQKVTSYHDQIRKAVIELMTESEKKRQHTLLADALEGASGSDLSMLVDHLIGSGQLKKAGTYAVEAAEYAAKSLAFESAAKLLTIALKLNPGNQRQRCNIQVALGEAYANAGYGAKAAKAFMAAAEGASMEEVLELRRQAAQQWFNTGHMPEAVKELNGVLKTVGLKLHRHSLSALAELIINRLHFRFRGLSFKKSKTNQMTRNQLLKMRASESAMVGLWSADTLQSAAFCARYLRLALESGSIKDIAKGFSTEAVCQAVQGIKKKAVVNKYIEKAKELMPQIDDPEAVAYVKLTMGMAIFSLGELPSAIPYLKSAEKIFIHECTRRTSLLDITHSFMGATYQRLGHWKKLSKAWDQWFKSAIECGNLYHSTVYQTWPMGCCRFLAADEVDQAQLHLQDGIDQWPWPFFDLQRMLAATSQSLIYRYENNFQKSYELCERNWKQLRWTHLRFVQMHRVVALSELAQSILGLVAQTGSHKKLLKQANHLADMLAREQFSFTAPFVPYIRSSIAFLNENVDSAVILLYQSSDAFRKGEYKLHTAAINYQLGRILKGEDGRILVEQAEEVMKEEGIVKPHRIANIIAPGFFKE